MFHRQDRAKGKDPVAEQREEVCQDGFEIVAAAEGESEGDDGKDEAPEEARDRDEVRAPELDGEGAGVDVGDEVGYCGGVRGC